MTRSRAKAIRRQLVRIAGTVGHARWFMLALLVELEHANDRWRELMTAYTWGPIPEFRPWHKSVRIPRSLRGRVGL